MFDNEGDRTHQDEVVTTLSDIVSSLTNPFINSQGNSFLIESLVYNVKTSSVLGLLYLPTTWIYPRTKMICLIPYQLPGK